MLGHIAKKSNAIDKEKTEIFEKSLKAIINSNKQFNRLESMIDWEKENLMSEDELEAWLVHVEKDADLFKSSPHSEVAPQ